MLNPTTTPADLLRTSIRVYHPARGWGEVTAARVPLMYQLHHEGPSQYVWIEWDERRDGVHAGWYDPAYGPWTFKGASSVAHLLQAQTLRWQQPQLLGLMRAAAE